MTTTGGRSSQQVHDEIAALERTSFTLEDALRLGLHATELARASGLPIIIEVHHGDRVAFKAALPGSVPDSDHWIARKANVVRRWQKSTLEMRVSAEEGDTTFNENWLVPETEYAAHGGGIPINVRGVGMVGGFYASGMPQLEDHDFLVSALRSFS
jgi:uncharacterized protein (UPF0303 family)